MLSASTKISAFPHSQWRLGSLGMAAAALVPLLLMSWLHAGLSDFTRLEQVASERYGTEGLKRVQDLKTVLERARSADERRQIRQINDFFNRNIRYMTDPQLWNQKEYWATPLETLGKGAGDCEDYAIAKYASLRMLGIPDSRLRLFYVHAQLGAAASNASEVHMVLGYYPTEDAEPMILDNMISDIRPASRRSDLRPVFSFNAQGLWPDGATTSAGDSTARLSNWRGGLERMQADGINLNRPIASGS
jgi:predicted transglutaminase-like cysteine proteinase